ncbi:hypothetical protein PRZ48_012380 [Zasmidium cellare]|uniref:Heterokaryon incompatibility domain-containing protein n=1 Tax=Zasmidium cellare TaxID=395010 RepID=A0ABR0E4N2_ZASCE|nr:hypothetical protein PRZ48_012380 [Zasmidium cellare]
MRLINVRTLQLHTFVADPPPYAILSHRWSDHELSLKDFQDPRKRHGRSFEKIVSFCHLIRSANKERPWDGGYQWAPIDWCWVDTVCIDKTSSSDLSEAINSMWAYYRDSVYCVAYLADVPTSPTKEQFCGSAWFTRGWTLQELLAPKTVVFYSSAWQFIGSKRLDPLLGELVSRASGVSTAVLDGTKYIENASIAMRMSWAARRITTRAEDMAYCLMGLFDVNMPLIYGEGGKKAFRRLQRAIIEQSDDESIFAFYGGGGGGMLADSPRAFRASGAVRRANRVKRSPYAITNKGLRIEGPAIRISERPWGDAFLMKLNCAHIFERPTNKNESRGMDASAELAQGCILGAVRENDRIFRHPGLEVAAWKWTPELIERNVNRGTWKRVENVSLLISLEEREGDVSSDNDSAVAVAPGIWHRPISHWKSRRAKEKGEYKA